MEARENSNTQLSLALGPRKNTKRGPRKNTKRVLSLELSLGAQQVQGQESSDENAKKSRLSKEQAAVLEANFNDHPNPDTALKNELADRLGLFPRQVDIWFQNRRARTKSKKNVSECERLKQVCKNLIEENLKLSEEIEKQKALATGDQKGAFYAYGLSGYVLVCPVCHQQYLIGSCGAM
ncbi:homeobox-leucine zipper protein HAT4-like [Coffea arabica]|uniref:Homeobox-leucine zipper protein HAT4-like n=1 Tax=Coffea arabica TaxID=13443 RepID=A0A6P6SWF6_COFAR|nr:homeobox-leucine zipper protein HAT14-like [Coffea arabica]